MVRDLAERILPPPYQHYNPPRDQWVELPVLRWEVGLVQVPLNRETGTIIKAGLRFHLPGGGYVGVQPYLDMTHKMLLQRFFRAWGELLPRLATGALLDRVLMAARLDPETPIPLRLRLMRRGIHPDSTYELQILPDWQREA